MRQKFLDAVDRMIRQADHDVLQPFDRIHLIEFAAGEEAVEDGGGLCPFVRAGKEIITAAYGNGAQHEGEAGTEEEGGRVQYKLGRPEGSKRISPKVIENLAAIRKYEKAGVSQEAIAKLIGVSRSTLIRNLKRLEEEGGQGN